MKPNPKANMFVEGYDLHMYCRWENPRHNYDDFPQQFAGSHRADTRKQAKKVGWIFHRDGYATCPKCAKDMKGPTP